MNYYNYLNKCQFEIDKKCMEKLAFTNNKINYIFSIIMRILYLGNIHFIDDENNIHSKIDPEKFENASYFLGISKENLTNILSLLNIEQSIKGRDTKELLSKFSKPKKTINLFYICYSCLFYSFFLCLLLCDLFYLRCNQTFCYTMLLILCLFL